MLARQYRRQRRDGYHPPAAWVDPRGFCAMKTFVATPANRQRDWYVVDAEGKTLGRLATQIADALRGKRKPEYTPHVDTGDFVVVVNAEKIRVTGDKLAQKTYWRHSGYPGGIKSRTLGEMLERQPGGSDPQGRQGDAAAQPPRPPAADQAEGLRRARPPARGAAAETDGDRTDLMRRRDRLQTRRPRRPPRARTPRSRGSCRRPTRSPSRSRGRGPGSTSRAEAERRRGAEPARGAASPRRPSRPRSPCRGGRAEALPRRLPAEEPAAEEAPRSRRPRRRRKTSFPGADLEPIAVEPEGPS